MSIEQLNWGYGPTQRAQLPSTPAGTGDFAQAWCSAARSREITVIQQALRKPGSVGVALSGAPGVGKSSLARTAIAGLGQDIHAIRLRSSCAGAETPYGCLSFLLARLPPSATASPAAILQGITALIRQDAAGRECVITLDSAAHIDSMSSGVLLNILLTGTARIIAITPDSGALPPDFHWLLSERRLVEVRLDNLNELQARQVLVSMLGNRVASSLVRTYHALVGGNPLLLRALVTEQLQCGNLVLSDGVWTLQDKVVLSGATSLEDIVRSRWERERPDCHEVIELLACSRRIPLVKLTNLYDAEIIADMEDAGKITVGRSDARWVTLTPYYPGEVIRSWLSIVRQRELRSRLLDGRAPDLAAMSSEDLIGFAAWTRDCEADLEPGLAVAAAAAAVQLTDPHFALSCLDSLQEPDPEWISGQRLRASAYLLLDQPEQAWAALEAIPARHCAALPPLEQALLAQVRCQVMVWLPGRCGDVPGVLKQVRRQLGIKDGAEVPPWPSPLAAAANRLKYAEFEYMAFVGDFAAMIPELQRAADPHITADPWFQIHSSLILMTALSFTGREMDALDLMDIIGGRLTEYGHMPGLRESYALHRYYALLLAGHWRRCLEVAHPGSRAAVFVLPHYAALPELLTGIAYVYAGRGAEAQDPLLSAIAQLEPRAGKHRLREAYAAIALAYAQQGNAARARHYLDRLGKVPGPAAFVARSVTEFCSLAASRWLEDPSAPQLLQASAVEDLAQGRFTLAGFSLLEATVKGTEEQFALLADASRNRQGLLAEVCGLVASGSRSRDAKVILTAAELAAGLELDAVEARCAATALDLAREGGDAITARVAQARLDRVSATLAALPVVPQRGSPLLTARERQVARRALGGASNREIAESMGVSVRTVEGHLYQVFTKLGVTSRGDLPGLL